MRYFDYKPFPKGCLAVWEAKRGDQSALDCCLPKYIVHCINNDGTVHFDISVSEFNLNSDDINECSMEYGDRIRIIDSIDDILMNCLIKGAKVVGDNPMELMESIFKSGIKVDEDALNVLYDSVKWEED